MTFTIYGVSFWTDINNFRRVQDYLKNEGFVNSNTWDLQYKDEFWFDDTLVYEENGVGLFRCSFHRSNILMSNNPNFEFKYWESKLVELGLRDKDSKVLIRDPMRRYIFEIYKMLSPVRVTNNRIEDINLESLAKAGEL